MGPDAPVSPLCAAPAGCYILVIKALSPCLLVVISASFAQGAEIYRGQLYCGTLNELAALPAIVDFEVKVDGSQATYNQSPTQAAKEVALLDRGTGTVSANQIKLTGGGSTATWRVASTYIGALSSRGLAVAGTQNWAGGGLKQQVSRTCEAFLVR